MFWLPRIYFYWFVYLCTIEKMKTKRPSDFRSFDVLVMVKLY